jgi:hypothetical protein
MGIPLTSSRFVRLMDKRLRLVEEAQYKSLTPMIPKLYNVINTDEAWSEFYSIGDVPDIPEFTGKLSYLSVAPGFHTRIEPKEYAAGIQIQRKLLDDKQYAVLDNMAAGLVKSSHRVREKLGVRTFANAFSSAYDFMTSEEGTSLCSSAHLTKSGTSTDSGFANTGTSALSPTSLAATRLAMRQFRSDISERIEMSDNLALIVPDNLADKAMQIVGTASGYDTAASDKNMDFQRYTVIPYLRLDDFDTNNWFMVDMDAMKQDLLWINRINDDINHTFDFETYLKKISIYFRVAYGWKNWRWVYGHAVS